MRFKSPRHNRRRFAPRVVACFILLLPGLWAQGANARERASALTADSPFATEIYAFLMEQEILNPPPCSTVFVGSSSIRFWFTANDDLPDRRIIRRGFGGSELSDVIYYFDLIVAPLKPKDIVLYAGENDLSRGKSPDVIADDMREFMEMKSKALGDAPVYFISIKPSLDRSMDREKQQEANRRIKAIAEQRNDLVYVDVASAMFGKDGLKDIFVRDGLHMNSDGYAIWKEIVSAALAKEPPATS
ncbi:MAG: hypothetical protein KDK34_20340, partial [Leptospiraceae bacterium]|nr:hypothetical protein [Leptospiraceae bacterium]